MQIRDGLHVFGRAPDGERLTDLLVALARLPRGNAPHQGSLIRALAADLELGFDPLDCDLGARWDGPRPTTLGKVDGWRTMGDTVERLEALARQLVGNTALVEPSPAWATGQREGSRPALDDDGRRSSVIPHPDPLPQAGEGDGWQHTR